MDILQMARDYGLTDPYINKLNASNQYIEDSYLNDRNVMQSQLNTQLSDYERYKQEQDQKATKEGQNAYIDYAKGINPYGSETEGRFKIGLGNSGLAESSMIGANNTYQNRVTETVNNRDKIFGEINSNMAKARETFNVESAKIEKAKQERMLENLWRVNDEYKAEKQAEEEKRRWEAEIALQRASARRSSGGGSGGRSSSGGSTIVFDDTSKTKQPTVTQQDIMKNVVWMQGPGMAKPIKDGLSGKSYSTMEELLNSYGYGSIKD